MKIKKRTQKRSFFGAGDKIWTYDLLITNQLHYHCATPAYQEPAKPAIKTDGLTDEESDARAEHISLYPISVDLSRCFWKKVGGKSFFFEKDLTKELVYGIIQVFRSEESFAKVVAGVAQWQSSWFVISRLLVRLRSPAPMSSHNVNSYMGDFPSGQRGQTVNLLSLTSVVRIHHLPPK